MAKKEVGYMALATQTIHDLRKKGWNFGLKDYPIWSEEYRDTLNAKLLNEYEFEEIGQETPDMFTFYLNRAMAKIMPYHIQVIIIETRHIFTPPYLLRIKYTTYKITY